MNELTGGTCSKCGHVSWPQPTYCSEGCGATIEATTLANDAEVYVDSVIHVPHPVFGSSYHLGYADLSAGPRVFGHFDSLEPVAPGTRVNIEVRDLVDPSDPERVVQTVFFVAPAEGIAA